MSAGNERSEVVRGIARRPEAGSRRVELYWRSVSGATAAMLTLALIYAGPLPFSFLVAIVAMIAGWEWSRLVRGDDMFKLTFAVHGVALIGAILLAMLGYAGLSIALIIIGAIVIFSLEFSSHPAFSASGLLATGLPAVALVWIREDAPLGLMATLLVIGVVVATDTGAFVVGRIFKGPKLAPRVSPNKTWAGAVGGLIGGCVAALCFGLVGAGAPLPMMFVGLCLSLAAQAGDLGESAVKRMFGVKDASNLIPGHGGVLDRVDGLAAAAAVAGLIALASRPQAPAAALFWGH